MYIYIYIYTCIYIYIYIYIRIYYKAACLGALGEAHLTGPGEQRNLTEARGRGDLSPVSRVHPAPIKTLPGPHPMRLSIGCSVFRLHGMPAATYTITGALIAKSRLSPPCSAWM